MSIPTPYRGSVALITGASSGIGRQIAHELCARGHDAVLVARRREPLETTAAELRAAYGRTVDVMPCDMADDVARRDLYDDIAAGGQDVSVLVLCAGFGSHCHFMDEPVDRLVQMVRTNLEAVITMSRMFAEPMVARRAGAILIVSSVVGQQPMPIITAYAATKAAVTSFGESLRTELRPHGVTVTVVAPGGVRTAFADVAGVSVANDMPDAVMSSPEFVARAAVTALERGRRVEMTRPGVRAFAFLAGHAPRSLWLRGCHWLLSKTV